MSATLTPGLNTPTQPPAFLPPAEGADATAGVPTPDQVAAAQAPALAPFPGQTQGGATPPPVATNPTIGPTAVGNLPSVTGPQTQPGQPQGQGGQQQTQPGLINNAPPVTPPAPGVPQASGYQAAQIQVTPEQTTSGQLSQIIAQGSPLMQQAEANARNLMNQRGLINSSMGITADQAALYAAATPIAQQNAQVFAQAAQQNAQATNTARQVQAQGQTTLTQTGQQTSSAQQIAQIQSSTTLSQTDKQTQSAQIIAQLNANTQLSVQDKASQTSELIANINANVSMSNQDKQDLTSMAMTQLQTSTQTYLGQLQANTQITLQDKAAQATAALAAVNNASAQLIARIQSDTSLSIVQQQTQSAQVIAGMNNDNARAVQQMVNDGALANIKANGVINEQITQMTNDNKTLLQTSAAAAQLYNQQLTNLSNIITNPNLSTDQQATALNDGLATLKDGLNALNAVAANKQPGSTLNFNGTNQGPVVNTGGGGGAASTTSQPAQPAQPGASDVVKAFTGNPPATTTGSYNANNNINPNASSTSGLTHISVGGVDMVIDPISGTPIPANLYGGG